MRMPTPCAHHTILPAILMLPVWLAPVLAAQHQFDIIVYGGTAGGAVAAIAAANEGCSVALLMPEASLEPVALIESDKTVLAHSGTTGGLAKEILEQSKASSLEAVLSRRLQEAGVAAFGGQRALRIKKAGVRIAGLTTSKGDFFSARVFVDASSGGALLPLAGISAKTAKAPRVQQVLFGEYVISPADLTPDRAQPDSIGLAVHLADAAQGTTLPFQIPYRALIPKRSDCDNLLTVECVSADETVLPALRPPAVAMVLGHSAGVAAAWAAQCNARVGEVNYTLLGKKLRLQKQILDVPGSERNRAAALGFDGVVVDNAQAQFTGTWEFSTAIRPFVGGDYQHDGNTDKGTKAVRFVPFLPSDGEYEVRVSCVPGSNRASNVPVIVNTADGPTTVVVNQKKPPKTPPFAPIGVFRFKAGSSGYVEIRTTGTDGHVIADAVQWLPRASKKQK
ncbi:MAG: FAD-dependent oxidoreductase [Candidatus Sumerlaeia bacterium]|nr:FAD-dependent oxidoreductase [Candidatus Sumerlaeia bacterium]